MTINVNSDKNFLEFLERSKPPCDYEKQLVLQHSPRISAILAGKIVPPYEVEIQPSSTCNLYCSHCFGRDCKRLENKMHANEMRHIIDDLCSFSEEGFSVDTIKFCGTTGEPLVNRSTADFVLYIKKKGRKAILYTNGVMLNIDAGRIVYSDKVNVSVDAASRETFLNIKKADSFIKVIKGLERLTNYRDIEKTNCNINASFVISTRNYKEIKEFSKLMKGIGVDSVIYRVDFTNMSCIDLIKRNIEELLEEAKSLSDEKFKVVSVYENEDICCNGSAFNSYGRRCYNHNFWACIGPDCNLYSCGHRTHGGVESFGNLLENSFKELWWSKNRIEGVLMLPDEHCRFCSPSSVRRNDFMCFLSKLPRGEFDRLREDYVFDG